MPDFYDLFGRNGMGLLQLMGLGGSGVGFGNMTLLIMMVAIVMFRSEKIVRIGAFRRAFYLIGASALMSPIVQLTFMLLAGGSGSRMGGDRDLMLLIMALMNHVPAILTAMSVIYIGRAIVPQFLPPSGDAPPQSTKQPAFQKEEPANRPPWLDDEEASGNAP